MLDLQRVKCKMNTIHVSYQDFNAECNAACATVVTMTDRKVIQEAVGKSYDF